MNETASAFSAEDDDQIHEVRNGVSAARRRLLRRPTTTETERIARGCAPEGLTIPIPVLVAAIRRETGCSRATAYRAIEDAFADGTLAKTEAQDT